MPDPAPPGEKVERWPDEIRVTLETARWWSGHDPPGESRAYVPADQAAREREAHRNRIAGRDAYADKLKARNRALVEATDPRKLYALQLELPEAVWTDAIKPILEARAALNREEG